MPHSYGEAPRECQVLAGQVLIQKEEVELIRFAKGYLTFPILLKEQQLGVQSREHSAKEAMSTDPARQDPKFPLSHQQQNT